MSKLEKAQQIAEAAPAIVDLLTLGIAGVMELAYVIKYDKCEIFIENNHHHDIYVALDAYDKGVIKGWYKIDSYSTSNIYETKRGTSKVGIYAECSECNSIWGNEEEVEIPSDGKAFEIEKYGTDFHFNVDYKKVKFSYSSDIRKRKKHTFTIN